jgi:hypothetical protein
MQFGPLGVGTADSFPSSCRRTRRARVDPCRSARFILQRCQGQARSVFTAFGKPGVRRVIGFFFRGVHDGFSPTRGRSDLHLDTSSLRPIPLTQFDATRQQQSEADQFARFAGIVSGETAVNVACRFSVLLSSELRYRISNLCSATLSYWRPH